MSDHTDFDFDADLDREVMAALVAEGASVEPDTETAWTRLDVGTRRRRFRAAPALVAAAAAAAVVVVAAVVVRDPDQTVDTDPAGTSTTVSADPSEVGPPAEVLEDGPRYMALVEQDGTLVAIDRGTGSKRTLANMGDPTEAVSGPTNGIDDVALSPDARWVYFSVCCSPAGGAVYRMPFDGSREPEHLAAGYDPSVSPDGSRLAFTTLEGVKVLDIATGDTTQTSIPEVSISDPSWSPDGERLAVGTLNDVGDHLVEIITVDSSEPPVAVEGIGSHPVWLDDDTLAGIDTSEVCDDCAEPTGARFREVTLDGTIEYQIDLDDVGIFDMSGGPTAEWVVWVDGDGNVNVPRSGHHSPLDHRTLGIAVDWWTRRRPCQRFRSLARLEDVHGVDERITTKVEPVRLDLRAPPHTLGVSTGSVKTHLHRGHEALRPALEGIR